MHADCIKEVQAVIGRKLTPKQIEGFSQRLGETMRQLARTDKEWGAKSHAERMQAAGDEIRMADIAAADKKLQRRMSNVVAQGRESAQLLERSQAMRGKNPVHKALFERLRNVDTYTTGIKHEIMGDLMDALIASEPRFLGLMENPLAVRDFAREVYGQSSGNAIAKNAAKVYMDVMEKARLRQNAAGADIGKLDYGYLPQQHDVGRIARGGKDKWVESIADKLDRSRYVDEDGVVMPDAEFRDMLSNVYDTLSTEGRNKMTPGQTGGKGSRAARFDDAHRALHFKDADSHLAYLGEYGRGGLLESISGHASAAAKNIGLMEQFGANPNSTYQLLKDMAEKADNTVGAWDSIASPATLDNVWDTLNGTTAQPVSASGAEFAQGVRNVVVATKLQGVLLSSITDAPLMMLAAKYNGMPMGETLVSTLKSFGGNAQHDAGRLGLAVDSIAGEMAQWHTGNLAQGWSGKMANATMKLGLVEQWTHALRRGFSLTLSGTLDTLRKTDWAALDPHDAKRFKAAGVKEKDWHIWQLADSTDYKGTKILSKDGLRNIDDSLLERYGYTVKDVNNATARLLGFIDQEAKTAVLAPDLMTRATLQQGTRSGTFGGEVLRSMMLFKSFPLAIAQKHLRRIEAMPWTGGGGMINNRLGYSAAMMSSLTFFGGLALQMKDVVAGKDPRDMTNGKFWQAAFMQGGGVGVFGDVLYTAWGGNARGGQANWTNLAGPVFGTAFDLFDVTLRNANQAMEGKKTNFGGELFRFAKGNTPLINLWYARAAIDRVLLNDLQESVSHGYLAKMKKRAYKDYKQKFWWEPGEATPDRAPDLEAAVGE